MELMSSGHISKTVTSAVPGGDYQYLLNALFVFIMQPQPILWNNSTDWLCKTEAFGLDKVPLRVRQFFCFWKLFVALNNCAIFFALRQT